MDPLLILEQLPAVAESDRSASFLVAYSGGMDSTVLLHLLHRLRVAVDFRLVALHVNHGISTESDNWAAHCADNCASLDVEFRSVALRLGGSDRRTSEAEARAHRYAWFKEQMNDGDLLLTAHHQHDQAETLLLNLMRGAGVRGLAAMQLKVKFSSGWLLRPLLNVSQDEIRDYAELWNLRFVRDPANSDLQYDRNYLRHHIVPALCERWPAAIRQIGRTTEHLVQSRRMQEALAELDANACRSAGQGFLSIGFQLSTVKLKSLDQARQINLLRYWTRQAVHSEPGWQALEEFVKIALCYDKKFAELAWSDYCIYRYQQKLYLTLAAKRTASFNPVSWDLHAPLVLAASRLVLVPQTVENDGLNPEKLSGKLSVRFRTGAERILLPNRGHTSSLKKLFQQHSIPPWERGQLPMICCQDELAAVVPWLVSEKFRAGEGERGISIRLDRM